MHFQRLSCLRYQAIVDILEVVELPQTLPLGPWALRRLGRLVGVTRAVWT
jgi:hypothetical protein